MGYPVLDINLDAIRTNAQVLCGLCAQNGISAVGVIKFFRWDLQVARAYRAAAARSWASPVRNIYRR